MSFKLMMNCIYSIKWEINPIDTIRVENQNNGILLYALIYDVLISYFKLFIT